MRDFRYGLRRLAKAPGFTAVVVLTLALGIGANTAIFSVVDALLLKPLPYRDPARLVTIEHFYPSLNNLKAPVSVPGFRAYSGLTHLFSSVAIEDGWAANLIGHGDPERLTGAAVSGRFFETLGVRAALGRTILPGEDQAGHDHVVVLSHGLWQRLLGGETGALGRQLSLNGEPYEIVGVMPASFRDPEGRRTELWKPLVLASELFDPRNFTNESYSLAARLRPGLPLERAEIELAAFAGQLKRDLPDRFPPDWTLLVTTLGEKASGPARPALLALVGAVGFVLLIACANVANLLLARAAGRSREIAIRTALGAGKAQLVRQLLAESLVLAAAGGALGLALAWWGVKVGIAAAAKSLPALTEVGIDGSVLAFTVGVTLLTGLLFGLMPALSTAASGAVAGLKEGGRGVASDRAGLLVRRVLVAGEIALALALLAGAGLFVRSFRELERVEPGFRPDRLLTFSLALPATQYPDDAARRALFDRVLARLATVPGVESVGGTSVLPFGGSWSTGSFQVEGYQPPPGQPGPWGDIRFVSPDYFRALGAPQVRGRAFADSDGPDAPPVAVVDEEMVRRFWPNADPIGKRLTFGGPPGQEIPWITVVGVVGHTKHEGLDADARVQVYLSYRQRPGSFMTFALRTRGEPLAVVTSLRAAVKEVDPNLPLFGLNTMRGLIDDSLRPRRFATVLFGFFAGIALLLAAIGIYGLMAYAVNQRQGELGVRMALGADRPRVLRLVLGQGTLLAGIGIAAGLAAALALTRLLASQLFGVKPSDPATFAAVTLVLGLVALLANALPAWKATRVDPVVVLRRE